MIWVCKFNSGNISRVEKSRENLTQLFNTNFPGFNCGEIINRIVLCSNYETIRWESNISQGTSNLSVLRIESTSSFNTVTINWQKGSATCKVPVFYTQHHVIQKSGRWPFKSRTEYYENIPRGLYQNEIDLITQILRNSLEENMLLQIRN